MEPALNEDERRALLRLARSAITDAVLRDGSLDRALAGVEITDGLSRRGGVFVTLKIPDPEAKVPAAKLRGCIGTFSADEPVYRAVIDTAPKAALEDPRFPPLEPSEIPSVRLGISVLGPPLPLPDAERIVIGRDGVILRHGFHRSVFLPQVAEEQGWNVRRLLEQLALKAGLSRDDWRDADLSTFRTESFAEPEDPGA
jgi:AmmeMemoRadiSam system protein A